MNQPAVQQHVQMHLKKNLPAYLNLLRQMVAINSFTANPAGVNSLAEFTAKAFAKLGFQAETVQSVNPNFGQHLILTKPGASGRTIGLVSHLDTVFPPEEETRHNFVWREAGHRIYGPGTVDIKGGTVEMYMLLDALQQIVPLAYEQITWVVLLDASEEQGGFDFGELCVDRLGPSVLAALIFEPGFIVDEAFALVAARKGMAIYRVTVSGRAAHAGNDHGHGANAIVQLADTIRQIEAMTDHQHQITFNVGIVSGGISTNRVPHHAEAYVEMRAFAPAVFEEGIAKMLALNGQSTVRSVEGKHPCRVSVELIRKVAPWPRNRATDRLLNIWQATAESLEMQVIPQERGGLSDGNFFWEQIPTLDGLGPAGGNMHCSEQSEDGSKEQEYVDASSLVPKALLNTMAVLRLVEE